METAVRHVNTHFFKDAGLGGSPFANSPDPFFYYPFSSHQKILNNLEISIFQRRGACVVLGEIGSGKTTLCRTLIQRLAGQPGLTTYLLLNPLCDTQESFFSQLSQLMHVEYQQGQNPFFAFQNFLFDQAAVQGQNIVLLIDEGQKLSLQAIESLRSLLNYETNTEKLIQIIIFGQPELKSKLFEMANFIDRLSYRASLEALSLDECREMIQFRLKKAGYRKKQPFFTEDALHVIHSYSGGFPRKICILCHKAVEHAVMKRVFPVDATFIQHIIQEELLSLWVR